jgi:hypothetical protein
MFQHAVLCLCPATLSLGSSSLGNLSGMALEMVGSFCALFRVTANARSKAYHLTAAKLRSADTSVLGGGSPLSAPVDNKHPISRLAITYTPQEIPNSQKNHSQKGH